LFSSFGCSGFCAAEDAELKLKATVRAFVMKHVRDTRSHHPP